MLKKILLPFFIIILIGCQTSSEPTVKYYLFDSQTHSNRTSSASVIVVVDNLSLPEYLNTRSIVQRIDPQQVASSNWHLWAMSPQSMLLQTTINDLQRLNPDIIVVTQKAPKITKKTVQNTLRLQIEINRFNGGLQHNAELAGNWSLWGLDNALIDKQSFNFSTPLEADGYAALTLALQYNYSQMMLKLSDAIKHYKQQLNSLEVPEYVD